MATIPSISLIPSGYKAGKVYSVLPTDGSADFNFSRNTTATRINKDSLIENLGVNIPRLDYEGGGCPSLLLEPSSTNLITQSEAFGNSYWTKSGASIEGDASTAGAEKLVNGDFATDSGWSKGTSWTISGFKANYDGVNNANALISTSGTGTVIGNMYKITFTISGGSASINFINSRWSGEVQSLYPVGTHTIYREAVATNATFNITCYTSGGGGAFSIDNVSVKEVSGFSAPSVNSPLGAFKLVGDANNSQHSCKGINKFASGTYAYSFYAKKNESNFIQIANQSTTDVVNFDLNNGTYNSIGSVSNASIDLLSNGFYRCVVYFGLSFTGIYIVLVTSLTSPRLESFVGTGYSTYIFGAQIEAQSYPTSYIPTSGSAQTRVAETANNAGDASTFNDSEGVLMAEIIALSSSDESSRRLGITKNGTYEGLRLQLGNGNISATVYDGTTNQYSKSVNIDNSISHKVALKYKANDFALYIDGLKHHAQSTGSTFVEGTLDDISFDYVGANKFYAKTRQVQYYNTALTDLELETLTSYTSFNAMALAQNYTI